MDKLEEKCVKFFSEINPSEISGRYVKFGNFLSDLQENGVDTFFGFFMELFEAFKSYLMSIDERSITKAQSFLNEYLKKLSEQLNTITPETINKDLEEAKQNAEENMQRIKKEIGKKDYVV